MNGSDLIVFILARGGSTRISLKNIAPLGSRTVLSFTLEDVLFLQQELPGLTCVLLTDHDAIAASASEDSCRPRGLEVIRQSADEAADSQEFRGIARVLSTKESSGASFEYVILLGGDCPLRESSLLRDANQRIRQLINPELIVQSVVKVPLKYHPNRIITLSNSSEEVERWPVNNKAVLSQDYPSCYALTGGVFAFRRNLIGKEGAMPPRKIHGLVTKRTLEIDTPADLDHARQILKHKDVR